MTNKIICVGCKLIHESEDRRYTLKYNYTMCPNCKCGGFVKVNINDK